MKPVKRIFVQSVVLLTAVLLSPSTPQSISAQEDEKYIVGATWNHDETQVLTWSNDHTARVWNTQTGGLLHTLGSKTSITGALWNSTSSQILIWAEVEAVVTLWDAQTGALLLTLATPGTITRANWHPNDQQIFTYLGLDDKAIFWDAQTGAPLLTLENALTMPVLNTTATYWLLSTWARIQVWDSETGELVFTTPPTTDSPDFRYRWSPTGTQFLGYPIADNSNTVKVWDIEIGKQIAELGHGDQYILDAQWSADGTRILTWSRSYIQNSFTTRIWSAQTSKLLLILPNQSFQETGGTLWSPTETQILTWSGNKLRIWDAQTGQAGLTIEDTQPFKNIQWNPDETLILTRSETGTATIWNAQTGELLWTLPGVIQDAQWNADGTQLLTVSDVAQLWDAETGKLLQTFSHWNESQ